MNQNNTNPIEGLDRIIYSDKEVVDFFLLQPVAQAL